jgi:membrane-bound lytic murein transglycosylase D
VSPAMAPRAEAARRAGSAPGVGGSGVAARRATARRALGGRSARRLVLALLLASAATRAVAENVDGDAAATAQDAAHAQAADRALVSLPAATAQPEFPPAALDAGPQDIEPPAAEEAAPDIGAVPPRAGPALRSVGPAQSTATPVSADAAIPSGTGHAKVPDYGMAIPWGEEGFESFRSAYLSEGGKAWLAAVMARARPYLPYIYERIHFYRLPEELAFLPVVESEYSVKAASRSGAAGLWQFMRNSIAGYGMRVDDWVDERRDFMKSTEGALRKLADNKAATGDWHLALAAYNMGLGAISRAVAKLKAEGVASPDYWELRRRGLLTRETSNYVPKFLAVASILRYPGRHGLPLSWEPAPAWEAIEIPRPVDLAILAREAGIDEALLRQANEELRYGVTPPSASYRLKVPAGSAEAARSVMDDPKRELVRYYIHPVRSGDTMSGIARRYGTPMAVILQANPGVDADRIKLGQTIVVPALRDASPPPAPEVENGAELDFSGSYTVVKGDTLWSLSLRFDVQPEVLAEKNGLGLSSILREGSVLRVPILK